MDISATLEQASLELKQGNKAAAQAILVGLVKQEPRNEVAWLLLAETATKKEHAVDCLERVLNINPNNEQARLKLATHATTPSAQLAKETELQPDITPLSQTAPLLSTPAEITTPPIPSALPQPITARLRPCPYCAEMIQEAAIICRFCGRDLVTGKLPAKPSPTSTELKPVLLDRNVESYVKAGWQVINRTPTTAQLKKPKQWSTGCLVLFVLLPALAGFIFPVLWSVAFVALLFAVVDYATKKDETVYLTEEQLLEEEQRRLEEQHRRDEQVRLTEQERIEKQRQHDEERRRKEEQKQAERNLRLSTQELQVAELNSKRSFYFTPVQWTILIVLMLSVLLAGVGGFLVWRDRALHVSQSTMEITFAQTAPATATSSSHHSGDLVTFHLPGSYSIFLARDDEAYQVVQDANQVNSSGLNSFDAVAKLASLERGDRVFRVIDEQTGKILDTGVSDRYFVEVLDGDFAGDSGWINRDWVLPVLPAKQLPVPTNLPISTVAKATQKEPPNDNNRVSVMPMAVSTQVAKEDKAVLMYIPAGEFLMGSTDSDLGASPDEKPQHTVFLDAFWIDRTEVTNAMFAQFVAATRYETDAEKEGFAVALAKVDTAVAPENWWKKTNGADWQHPRGPTSDIIGRSSNPVIQMSWNDAFAYCLWAGRRLPTEAEWEKAARGTDGRLYPWGNNKPNVGQLNAFFQLGDTAKVGSYPLDISPFGVMDMAGNVNEWVADKYRDTYYASSPYKNPHGPVAGDTYVVRGASWLENQDFRITRRNGLVPQFRVDFSGFRCALDKVP